MDPVGAMVVDPVGAMVVDAVGAMVVVAVGAKVVGAVVAEVVGAAVAEENSSSTTYECICISLKQFFERLKHIVIQYNDMSTSACVTARNIL